MKEQTTYAHDVRLAGVELARTEHERAEYADAAHLYTPHQSASHTLTPSKSTH
jgi:hypothetical protein